MNENSQKELLKLNELYNNIIKELSENKKALITRVSELTTSNYNLEAKNKELIYTLKTTIEEYEKSGDKMKNTISELRDKIEKLEEEIDNLNCHISEQDGW